MDASLLCQLLEETISLAQEENLTGECSKFTEYLCEMLPQEILSQLEEINGGGATFLEDIWEERFAPRESARNDDDVDNNGEDELGPGVCLVCERKVRLTRHHVFPREVHKTLVKKGYESSELNTTIPVCRMCHSTIHRFFSNQQLASAFFSVELLLADERFFRYAKWAAAQSSGRFGKL